MSESDEESRADGGRLGGGEGAAWRRDLALAASFLTRLPIAPAVPDAAEARRSFRAYPLVGAGIGLAAGAVLALALGVGLPPAAAAIVAVAVQIALTGGLHEDGLADLADGLGPADRARRLEVMRDSRIGTFGVLALILGVGARIAAVAALA
ncbi:MAG: adenosylcobinamide-GDP ribazoletransferase, partial [Azospirillaceae bacterium]